MKHLLIYFLLIVVTQTGYGQTNNWGFPLNLDCEYANKLCFPRNEDYILNNYSSYCTQILYYSFRQSALSPNFVNFQSQGSGGQLILRRSTSSEFCDIYDLTEPPLIASVNFGVYQNITIPFNQPGYYILEVKHDSCYTEQPEGYNAPLTRLKFSVSLGNMNYVDCPDPGPEGPDLPEIPEEPVEPQEPFEANCKNCITSFSPNPGKYIVSAWVSEDNATTNTVTYTKASLSISFSVDPPASPAPSVLTPSGRIIDGWQRIEGVIEVPVNATDIHMTLQTSSGAAYFDDIRFYPLDGSMVSYVYDPINLRLMAQLDERNYATFYEYDEEGKLIRVKKETERGVMTIQENRDNTKKQ